MSRALEASLLFDPAGEAERLSAFIRKEVDRRGSRGVALGLSGGLDSTTCAYLSVRALPASQIHLLSLPERDSSTALYSHAQLVARRLGLPLEERDISGMLGELGLYSLVTREVAANRAVLERSIRILRRLSGSPGLFPWAQQYAFARRQGILAGILRRWLWRYTGAAHAFVLGKPRTRMLVLSTWAMQMDCLLICTTDRSEWSIGFYDPHGDGVGDIAPLRHLYKTQIRELAGTLGVPAEILGQPSSGDLAAGLPNEVAMGMRYEELDRVLAGLSLGMTDEEVAEGTGVRQSFASAVRSACALADERRRLPVVVA